MKTGLKVPVDARVANCHAERDALRIVLGKVERKMFRYLPVGCETALQGEIRALLSPERPLEPAAKSQ